MEKFIKSIKSKVYKVNTQAIYGQAASPDTNLLVRLLIRKFGLLFIEKGFEKGDDASVFYKSSFCCRCCGW